MAGASFAYVALTLALYLLAGLGDAAVVYANIANLLGRILYCSFFITRGILGSSTNETKVRIRIAEFIPPRPVLVTSAMAAIITRASLKLLGVDAIADAAGRNVLKSVPCFIHMGIGILCALSILTAW